MFTFIFWFSIRSHWCPKKNRIYW